MNENRSRATSFKDLRSLRITINISSKLNFLINPSKKKNPNYYSNSIDRRTNWMKRKQKRKRKVNSITKKHSSMKQWEIERERVDLATDDGDGGKRVPKSRQCTGFAVVTESGTSSLDFVDEWDQVLHLSPIGVSVTLWQWRRSDSDPPDLTAGDRGR